MHYPPNLSVPVLLVDDREENLLSLEALLKRDGLVILKARSGVEALELLLKHEVALTLLDVQMPEMDGYELAELMRGSERTRRVPIIFLTAGTADRTRRFRGYEAGAVDFLEKPIEPDILRSKVDVFFDLYRHRLHIAAQRDVLQSALEENQRLLNESHNHAEALKQADSRKDEFLATLAHELRNPLAPIRNGLQILRMSQDPRMADKVIEVMDLQMTHLVRLIDDLLDISRVSRGKIDLKPEPVTLQTVISTALETSGPVIEAARHQMTIVQPDEPVTVTGDLTRLAQVVSNLLNNAAKYTPPGGQIEIALQVMNGRGVVSVRDNGLGIEAEMLSRVFDLFTQVERNMGHSQGGLGIGLALARQLIEMHGGSIGAESEGSGKGATFYISLPLSDDATVTTSADQEAGEVAVQQSLDVLVIDDNRELAQTTCWMLELVGHNARVAHDGVAALEAAGAQVPDAILLDIGMPGMDGYQVCIELRKMPALKNTPIIAQTGWGQTRDREKAFEAGFDHHITKPLSLDAILKVLNAGRADAQA